MLRRKVLLPSLLACGLATGLVFSSASAGSAAAPSPVTTTSTYRSATTNGKITTSDGVVLATAIYSPIGATGLRPLLIIPSAWGGESGQMAWSAQKLAERGFIVLNYATRGFADSGGLVEMAGPRDTQDVSDVIDWALENTPSDVNRIGIWGLSYGAGLALLAAATEPRIKAVGSLEGFTDLVRTAYPNRTRSTFLMGGLLYGAVVSGRLSPGVDAVFDATLKGGDMGPIVPYLQARSPITMIDRINRNGAKIMMATSWNDMAYGTDQVTDFYRGLTNTKRLEVRPGDHVVNEVPASIGLGDGVMYGDLFDWMTTYVGGTDTPLVHQPPVWMQPRSSGAKPAPETYSTWADVTRGRQTFTLGRPTGLVQATGPLTAGPVVAPYSSTIDQGGDPAAGVGVPIASFAGEAVTATPPNNLLWAVNRSKAVFWQSDPLTSGLKLRGQQSISVSVTPTAATGTLTLYLYDSEGAVGHLISHRPYSFSGAKAGAPMNLTVPLQPTAYDLPAGHRLAVAVTGGDFIYGDENPEGARLAVGATAGHQATLTVGTGS